MTPNPRDPPLSQPPLQPVPLSSAQLHPTDTQIPTGTYTPTPIPECYNSHMLRFGPGGVPLSTKITKDPSGKSLDARQSGLYRLKELGLNHMEVEFVYGVNISEENAVALGKLAKEFDITLTAHAPYYINLAAPEKPKYYASINRVKKTLWAAGLIGAKSITFHPAFYMKRPATTVSKMVKDALTSISKEAKSESLMSLETTGKVSQWGSLDEILEVARAVNKHVNILRISVCVDFAHLHARSNGQMNSYKEFDTTLKTIKNQLGTNAMENLHIHVSGINYNNKGERKHLNLKDADLNYKDLLKALRDNKVSGWVVCESPNLEEDALLMKKYYDSL